MSGTMTYVGFDVHARSAHAAAVDVMTGELSRVRFGPVIETPVDWLTTLSGPVRACYEAGPTGFGLARALAAAGIDYHMWLVDAADKTQGRDFSAVVEVTPTRVVVRRGESHCAICTNHFCSEELRLEKPRNVHTTLDRLATLLAGDERGNVNHRSGAE